MKDQKLIYAIRGIDDDLICEAMRRRNVGSEQDGEEPETVYVTGVRTRRLWKYPVTAAAVLAVAGGALFVIGYNVGIPDNLGAVTGEETVGSVEETDSGEASAADDTDTTDEETQPVVSEAVEAVVPYKIIQNVDDDLGFNFTTALYVDSYPKIPQPDFEREYFTEMSTKELLDYYGFFNNIAYYLDSNQIIEIVDENNPHGIYTYPDGSVYDINTFTFELTEVSVNSANKFTVTVGKKAKFGQEYCEYYKNKGSFYKCFLHRPMNSLFYNEEKDLLFTVFKYYGVTIMFSATPDEITNNNFADDPELRDNYNNKGHDDDRVPHYYDMLINVHINCLSDEESNYYFDHDAELWYNKERNEYLNEETFEWIPAEEWVFD